MIILNGPTGSGKTSILKELHRTGKFDIIPTYSTRPARNNDFDVHHVSQKEMDLFFANDKVFSFISYDTEYGPCEYCILKEDIKENLKRMVVIGNEAFTRDLINYVKHQQHNLCVSVFLNVDYKTILETSNNGNETDKDRLTRLKRDFKLMNQLKSEAGIIISNYHRQRSAHDIAREIIDDYEDILRVGYIPNNGVVLD